MRKPNSRFDWDAASLQIVFRTLAALAIVVLVAPSLIVIVTSFTASQSLKFPPEGLSLRWYRALFDATQMQNAAWNSLVVAVWTTAISSVLGTAAALAIARSKNAWVKGWDMVFMSPLVLPALAFGFAALITIGCAFSLVFQALINMAVAVNLFPVTGQPLPMLSMGGTSIWFTSLALGIILSVSSEMEKSETEEEEKVAIA